MSDSAPDPVLARRALFARLALTGKRVGYGLLSVAIVAFFAGLARGFEVAGPVVAGALGLCTVVLAPAIILGYAVRAAEREDRRTGRL